MRWEESVDCHCFALLCLQPGVVSSTATLFVERRWQECLLLCLAVCFDSGTSLQMTLRPSRAEHGRGVVSDLERTIWSLGVRWVVHRKCARARAAGMNAAQCGMDDTDMRRGEVAQAGCCVVVWTTGSSEVRPRSVSVTDVHFKNQLARNCGKRARISATPIAAQSRIDME